MAPLDSLHFMKFVLEIGIKSTFKEAQKHTDPRGGSASPLIKSESHESAPGANEPNHF